MAAEFICAGHYLELWEIIITFMSQHIHLGNPKLPLYIRLRYDNFRTIISAGYKNNELQLRNNKKIRILFAEIISILSLSQKKIRLHAIKVEKKDFVMSQLSGKLKADSIAYATAVFRKKDPKELFIAINEFGYHLYSANMRSACYWLEWLLAFNTLCQKGNSSSYNAARRVNISVETKYQTDMIWIIWELLLANARKKKSNIMSILEALLSLFCIRYQQGVKKRRRFVLYFAIMLVVEPQNITIPIYTQKEKIENIKQKIDVIYRQIKKNEITPDTDYLFNNSITGKTNIEKTIHKLDRMNAITGFIPRQ